MIRLEVSFLVGLYAYIEQAQLSIHRVIGHPWKTLIQYYDVKRRYHPNRVVAYLQRFPSHRNDQELDELKEVFVHKLNHYRLLDGLLELYRFRYSISAFWNWYVKNCVLIEDEEIYLISHILKRFSELLSNDEAPEIEVIISVRMDLYLSLILIKKYILPHSIHRKVQSVEHFNQNEFLTYIDFSEIVEQAWLDKHSSDET